MDYEKDEWFIWCDLMDYAALVPKMDFFGTASSLCNVIKDAAEVIEALVARSGPSEICRAIDVSWWTLRES